MRFAAYIVTVVAVAAMSGPAIGQEAQTSLLVSVEPATVAAPLRTALSFTLGAGVAAAPGYFGSDKAVLAPTGAFLAPYLHFGTREFGTADPWAVRTGLYFGGSLRFVGERSADLYPELVGLATIDPALEIGGGVSFAQPSWEFFVALRQGIGGHESTVGEVGMDMIARPSDALTLMAGPRFVIGSDDFAATYFGVSAAQAAASGFNAYSAEGGLLGAGVALGATYNLGGDWGLNGQVSWERLQGSAAGSPISQQGSDDQFSAGLVATRRFSLEF